MVISDPGATDRDGAAVQHAPDRDGLAVGDDRRLALAVDRELQRLPRAGIAVGDVRAATVDRPVDADSGVVDRDGVLVDDRGVPGGVEDPQRQFVCAVAGAGRVPLDFIGDGGWAGREVLVGTIREVVFLRDGLTVQEQLDQAHPGVRVLGVVGQRLGARQRSGSRECSPGHGPAREIAVGECELRTEELEVGVLAGAEPAAVAGVVIRAVVGQRELGRVGGKRPFVGGDRAVFWSAAFLDETGVHGREREGVRPRALMGHNPPDPRSADRDAAAGRDHHLDAVERPR